MSTSVSYSAGSEELAGLFAALGVSMLFIWLLCIVAVVITLVGQAQMFKKAGKKGYIALIPTYNIITEMELTGMPIHYWFLLYCIFIPFVGFIAAYVFLFWKNILLAKSFGKGTGFGVLLTFFPFVMYPILGFSKKIAYVGPSYVDPHSSNNYPQNGQQPYQQNSNNPYDAQGNYQQYQNPNNSYGAQSNVYQQYQQNPNAQYDSQSNMYQQYNANEQYDSNNQYGANGQYGSQSYGSYQQPSNDASYGSYQQPSNDASYGSYQQSSNDSSYGSYQQPMSDASYGQQQSGDTSYGQQNNQYQSNNNQYGSSEQNNFQGGYQSYNRYTNYF